MKRMPSLMLIAAAVAVGCSPAAVNDAAVPKEKPAAVKPVACSKSVPKGWIEDFAAAKRQAEKENKRIVMAISGSDWCPWCVKLDKDVYARPKFVAEASKNFVLVMIDNPQDRSILSPLAQEQNESLLTKYGVRGYPTTLVLDAKGEVLARFSGYRAGGPAAMLKALAEVK